MARRRVHRVGVYIDTPATARNTDGIDPGDGAKDVTIADSYISDADDGIVVEGATATGSVPTRTFPAYPGIQRVATSSTS